MIKRLLHCRCCGQLSPAEYNCCPKYHNAMAEITQLKEKYYLALGWWYAEACSNLDNGIDTREINLPETIERMERDLGKTEEKAE